jgi:hypothetical protein
LIFLSNGGIVKTEISKKTRKGDIMKPGPIGRITTVVMLTGILLLPGLHMVSQTAATPPALKIELKAQLQLTDEQEAEVERIYNMANSQAELDRQNFKGNTLALIEAAKRRRDMTDSLVEALLKPEQKILFKNYREKRNRDEEFFMLKEGLSLNQEQCYQVKNILDEYRGSFDPEQEKMRVELEERGDQMMGYSGQLPGEIPGTVPGRTDVERRGSYGFGRGENLESRLLNLLRDVDEKIAKKINPILTKEQQKMYEIIRKMQQDSLQKRLSERLNRTN